MKNLFTIVISAFLFLSAYSQTGNIYQSGITGEENLRAIANLAPYSPGGYGFDTRYEGVKGTPRLFDTLLTSFILVKGQEKYIRANSDIDVIRNVILFTHPSTGKLMEIPSDIVAELIVSRYDKELIYRTTRGLNFEKENQENKFFEVLKEGPCQFIRMPAKTFVEADYQGGYSADRRYDEYKTINKYYIEGADKVFHQVQLNKKSLAKLFPDKKELIYKSFEEKSESDIEAKVVSLLKEF